MDDLLKDRDKMNPPFVLDSTSTVETNDLLSSGLPLASSSHSVSSNNDSTAWEAITGESESDYVDGLNDGQPPSAAITVKE